MLEDGQAKHQRSKLDGGKSMGPEDAGDIGPCYCETTLSHLEGRGNQERSLMTRERCLPSKERRKGECGEGAADKPHPCAKENYEAIPEGLFPGRDPFPVFSISETAGGVPCPVWGSQYKKGCGLTGARDLEVVRGLECDV